MCEGNEKKKSSNIFSRTSSFFIRYLIKSIPRATNFRKNFHILIIYWQSAKTGFVKYMNIGILVRDIFKDMEIEFNLFNQWCGSMMWQMGDEKIHLRCLQMISKELYSNKTSSSKHVNLSYGFVNNSSLKLCTIFFRWKLFVIVKKLYHQVEYAT